MDVLSWLVANISTLLGGIAAGAVYWPVELIEPYAVPLFPFPGSDQVTFWLLKPVTVAENCTVPPSGAVIYPDGVTLTD